MENLERQFARYRKGMVARFSSLAAKIHQSKIDRLSSVEKVQALRTLGQKSDAS